jgi:RNA polymerase sigma-70 factor (ECF subfamily)
MMQLQINHKDYVEEKNPSEMIFRNYSRLIYKYIIQFVRLNGLIIENHEYDDIFQEIALKLIKNKYAENFDEKRSSMKTWLSIISKTSVIDYMRKRNRHANETNIDIYENELQCEQDKLSLELPKGLLTERQEQVVRMYFQEGFEAGDIAQRLEITSRTARSIKHQALERLRRHMGTEPTDIPRRAS